MSSPTLSLCLIVKNEERNLPNLLKSIEGLVDEVVLVDTGSTDKTKEIARAHNCQIFDFEWVNSFALARNFAFSKATQDYILWLDGDDVLSQKSSDSFLSWKKNVMGLADCHLATYHYALDDKGLPVISFMRERVFKRSLNPTWQYDLHEGIILRPEWTNDYATSWVVNHMRTAEDIVADKSRNLTILKKMRDEGKIDARMQFYYGKELFEGSRPLEALHEFDEALKRDNLEPHDKMLTCQYAGYSAGHLGDQLKDEFKSDKDKWYDKAISYGLEGLRIDANRAEYNILIADCYIKKGDISKAIPHYAAAKASIIPNYGAYQGPIYNFANCYGEQPGVQLAKIYLNIGMINEAEKEAKDAFEKYKNKEAEAILEKVKEIRPLITLDNGQIDTEDIVFTCPPVQAYPFDEIIYETRPLGGSETALVQMAKELKKQTGRPVKVFNVRDEDVIAPSGVEYISNRKANLYFSKNRPKVNISWRHNIEVTRAKSYLWCHDLQTPGVDVKHNFDKHLCLSEFHKNFVMGKQGVPADKIVVTRNGITPEKFNFVRSPKNPNKVVWMSSPDRGLDRCMHVMDEVLKEYPELELHVYYGIENLYKYGPQMSALADKLKNMMDGRSYVKYHGFTEQNKMYRDVSDAVIWLHPCNFIESFCITALEMLELGVFPITRRLGALQNTLAQAEINGQAVLLDHDCVTPNEILSYANEVKKALVEKKWECVNLDKEAHSWASVAYEWKQMMEL